MSEIYRTIDPVLKQRFHERHTIGDENDCWPWTSTLISGRYGVIRFKGATYYAHRLAWRIYKGPIPYGMHVLHTCGTFVCCNPSHLVVGWQHEGKVGESNHLAKLTKALVAEIRQSTESAQSLAARLGVTPNNIDLIRQRKTWKHVG